MGRSVRGPSDQTLDWVEKEPPDKLIPFDVATFWDRLCSLVNERIQASGNDKLCVEWLTANVKGITRRTFSRWSKHKTRPQWGKVDEVLDALNKTRPANSAKLTRADLVRGLSLREPGLPELADHTTAAVPAPRRTDPPAGGSGVADLDRLLAKVKDALRRAPALAAALADRGYGGSAVDDPASDVACALVTAAAKHVAMDLADLVRTLDKHRDVARDVLWHILPLAGDWNDVLGQARTAGTERGTLELRLRTETIAEIVVARVEARCCLYAPGDLIPQGAAHIPLPAAAYAPFFDPRGTGLVEAVLINLWDERRPDEPRLPGEQWWQGIRKGCASREEFMIAAAGEINASAFQDAWRYLLVVDAKLDPRGIQDLDASWAVAQAALGAALPGLRLVRLKGGVEEMKTEYDLIPYIRAVRDRS